MSKSLSSTSALTLLRADEKLKTNEYLLFEQPHLKKYNVKFGDEGRTYDVKQKRSSSSSSSHSDIELWVHVSKGNVIHSSSSESPSSSFGDMSALASTLRDEAAQEKDDENKHALNEVADALLEAVGSYASSITRVFTRKHLTELEVPLASEHKLTIEQIDFSLWPSSSSTTSSFSCSSPRRVFRSVSLEGTVPNKTKELLLQLLQSTTYVNGGLSTTLATLLKNALKPLELMECA